MEINIRNAKKSDYRITKNLFRQSDELHRLGHPDVYCETQEECRPKKYFNDLISDIKSKFLVAEINNQVVGLITASIKQKGDWTFQKRSYLYINDIVVSEQFRGKGIGKLLMQSIIDWAKTNKCSAAELNVYLFNKGAIKLYENMGFAARSQEMFLNL